MVKNYFSDNVEDSRYVTALARGLMILSCFNDEVTQLTHQQLCERTGLPKATISRLIFTLVSTGYLTHANKNTYQVGINALKLAYNATTLYDISKVTIHTLEKFALTHQVSVNIATHHQGMMRYVACYRSPARIAVNLEIGSEVPIATTAIGKAFYATAENLVQEDILKNLYRRLTPESFQKAVIELEEATKFYQQHNYSSSAGDFIAEIVAIAVGLPPTSSSSLPHYSVNISVPKTQFSTEELVEKLLPSLQHLSIELNEQLSFL